MIIDEHGVCHYEADKYDMTITDADGEVVPNKREFPIVFNMRCPRCGVEVVVFKIADITEDNIRYAHKMLFRCICCKRILNFECLERMF